MAFGKFYEEIGVHIPSDYINKNSSFILWKIAAPFKIEITTNRITKNIFISTFQGTFKQVNKPGCNLATLWGNVINIFETTQCSLFFRFQQSIHSIFNTWNILDRSINDADIMNSAQDGGRLRTWIELQLS